MKKIYFIILMCLFSTSLSRAQDVAPGVEDSTNSYIDEYVDFCGEVYYELENGEVILRWDNTCRSTLCYQILVYNDVWGQQIFATLSGEESSYVASANFLNYAMMGAMEFLAFYDNGEVGKSNELHPPDILSYPFLGNFDYSYEEWGVVRIHWKATGVLPLYYEIECDGFNKTVPGEHETYYEIPEHYLCHDFNLVCIHAVYENGEDHWEELVIPNPYISPHNFRYEVHGDNHFSFDWELQDYDWSKPFQIECNGESISGDIWDIHFDSYDLGIGKLRTYYDANDPFLLHTDMLYIFQLYAIYDDMRVRAKNNLFYNIQCAVPFDLEYSTNSDGISLYWKNQEEGKRPLAYRIIRNGEEIAEISSDETQFEDYSLPNGRYTYVLLSIYENDVTFLANNVVNVFYNESLPISIPYNLSGIVENINNVVFNWNVSPNGIQPHSFQIERNGMIIAELLATARAYTDTNLPIGYYTYHLLAHYSDNTVSQASNPITVTIEDYILQADFLPQYFVYTVQSENNIAIVWIDTAAESINPSYFLIERNGRIIDTLESDKNMYFDTNLNIGTYSYRLLVYARDPLFSATEDYIMLTIDSIPSSISYAFPESFIYYTENNNDVVLRWNIPFKGELKPLYYLIGKNGNIIDTINNDAFIYFDTGLDSNTTHQYILLADYDDGMRLMSDTLVVAGDELKVHPIIPNEDEVYIEMFIGDTSKMYFPPENFLYAVADSTVTLTWETPRGRIPLYYQIERNGEVVAQVDNTLTSHIDANLEVGTYTYRLSAHFENDRILHAVEWAVATIRSCK